MGPEVYSEAFAGLQHLLAMSLDNCAVKYGRRTRDVFEWLSNVRLLQHGFGWPWVTKRRGWSVHFDVVHLSS